MRLVNGQHLFFNKKPKNTVKTTENRVFAQKLTHFDLITSSVIWRGPENRTLL